MLFVNVLILFPLFPTPMFDIDNPPPCLTQKIAADEAEDQQAELQIGRKIAMRAEENIKFWRQPRGKQMIHPPDFKRPMNNLRQQQAQKHCQENVDCFFELHYFPIILYLVVRPMPIL